MVDLNDLEEIKKDIAGESKELKVADVNILFLDISSSCTGYSIAKVDFEQKKAVITKTGAIWFNPNWDHQEKYLYLHEALVNYFWVVQGIDYIVKEAYAINPKRRTGCQVGPELSGVVKVAAWQNGVKVSDFTPQSWRSELGIKPSVFTYKGKTKKDYKGPTKDYILQHANIPEECISNITMKSRKTPDDLFDALGIAMGWLKRYGLDTKIFSSVEINPHLGVLE